MSMNLHCNKMQLWQTPTWVTYMCLITDKGFKPEVKGKQARAAANRYMEWVRGLTDGAWGNSPNAKGSKEDLEHLRLSIRNHLETLQQLMCLEDFKIYYM